MSATFTPSNAIKLEWLNLIQSSNFLIDLETFAVKNFDIPLVSHAFYTIRGVHINDTPEGMGWQAIRNHSAYPQIIAGTGTDDLLLINATLHLSRIYMDTFIKDEVAEKAQDITKRERKEMQKKLDEELEELVQQMQQRIQDNNPEDPSEEGESDSSQDDGSDADGQEDSGEGEGSGVVEVPVDVESELDLQAPELQAAQLVTELLAGLFAGFGYVPPQERIRQMEDLRQMIPLKKLAEMMGSIKQISDAALRETKTQAGAVIDSVRGEFGRNTRFTERAGVANKEITALAKFGDNGFNNRQRSDITPAGLGNIELIRDESSSMGGGNRRNPQQKAISEYGLVPANKAKGGWEGFDHLTPDEQAFNIEVALAAIANAQGRKLVSYPFDSHKSRVFDYKKDPYEAWKRHATTFFGGGTAINHVLSKVLDNVVGSRGDILILTDGQIGDSPDEDPTLKAKLANYRSKGGHVWVVYIGVHSEVKWADHTIHVKDLMDANGELYRLFRGVNTDRSSGRKAF